MKNGNFHSLFFEYLDLPHSMSCVTHTNPEPKMIQNHSSLVPKKDPFLCTNPPTFCCETINYQLTDQLPSRVYTDS